MPTRFRSLLLALAVVATGAHAGMYDQPYALVERGDPSEMRKEATVAITKIDGKSLVNPRKSDPIPPGRHTLTVRFDTSRGVFEPDSQEVVIDLDPCVRYRIVATYESRTGPDWKPKVYAESIGECRKKFGL